MEDFLANVCTVEWNERQDAGRTFAEAHAELLPLHATSRTSSRRSASASTR
jgi:2-haloacid dehalogenase